MNDFCRLETYTLDRHQVFDAVLGKFQNVLLTGVVFRISTLVGCTVLVLHRELTAAITDAKHGAAASLESLWSLFSTFGLPDVQLRYPRYL